MIIELRWRESENRISNVFWNVKNGLNLRLFVIMASKRKWDDVNVVAPDKTKELTGSGGNGSLIVSDHYQNILNNWQSMQEFMGKSFRNDKI